MVKGDNALDKALLPYPLPTPGVGESSPPTQKATDMQAGEPD